MRLYNTVPVLYCLHCLPVHLFCTVYTACLYTCSVLSTLAACTPVLYCLHWLPVHQRIVFELLLLVYRAVQCLSPTYLLVTPYTPTRSLRSAEQGLLTVPRYHLECYGRCSFSVAGPILWNCMKCPASCSQAC